MIQRTFLRLCALEALRPSALLDEDDPQWPTIGANYVYDSRLDPIDDLSVEERRPVVVIYTEDDSATRINQSGPVYHKNEVDLIFEIAAIANAAPDSEFVAGTAYTDSELEATLDTFEDQIYFALHFGPTGKLFRQIAKGTALSKTSHPWRSSEEGIRLAARTIKFKFEIREVCYQAVPSAPATGLDRLPPRLKEIADQLAGSTYLAKIIGGVAGKAPVMPTLPQLASVGLEIRPQTPDADDESISIVGNAENLNV